MTFGAGSGGSFGGNAVGGFASGHSGWGVDFAAKGASAAQGHADGKPMDFPNDNAFSATGMGEPDAKHDGKGFRGLHHKKHGHDFFRAPTFASLPDFPTGPGAEPPEPTAEPPSSPFEQLADVPPTLQQFDNEQSRLSQACQEVLTEPGVSDDEAARVCLVFGTP
jgi:hypothetical protein